MIVEIMGNKAGWLTLYTGIAGGADIIIIPEVPYDIDKVIKAASIRDRFGKPCSVIAVAEGAMDVKEAAMKKKERAKKRAEEGIVTVSSRIAKQVQEGTGYETRVTVPGHMLRGGTPSAYDRVLSTKFGARAATLIMKEKYGYSVAKVGDDITENKLSDVANKTKFVTRDDKTFITAQNIGVSFGE
jgi:6-phosphofructokinase 1